MQRIKVIVFPLDVPIHGLNFCFHIIRNSCSLTSVPAGLQVETKMKDSFDIEKLDIPTGLSRPGPLTSKAVKVKSKANTYKCKESR